MLTTKRAHKGFYKGNGATKEGRITSKGKFIVQPWKQVELVVPDLTGFKVSRVALVDRDIHWMMRCNSLLERP